MATKIQVRRDTAANWTSVSPILSEGEIGFETDTNLKKVGDGSTTWPAVPYDPILQNDTNANWTSRVPLLADGEVALESDTHALKAGDGSTTWAALPYVQEGSIKTSTSVAASITAAHVGRIYEFKSNAAAAAEFTLPATPADGYKVRIINDSQYTLTVGPGNATDFVWNSGAGYGIELPDRGTMVELRYDATNLKWDILNKVGGKVLVEGLVLDEPMGSLSIYEEDSSSYQTSIDLTGKHKAYGRNSVKSFNESFSKFAPGCFSFGGTDEHMTYADSTDWDIFGTDTGHKTVSAWVYFDDAAGTAEGIIVQHVGANDGWYIIRKADGSLQAILNDGSTFDISGGALAQTTWHHIALVIVTTQGEVGLYIDGTQVAYDAAHTQDTFAASLLVGQLGGGVNYMDGRMQNLQISYNNPLGAAPNVGVTDTFTKPAQPTQLMMK